MLNWVDLTDAEEKCLEAQKPLFMYVVEWNRWKETFDFGVLPYRLSKRNYDADRFWSYPIARDGAALKKEWANLEPPDDNFLTGLLADWLIDHRSELLTGATGPSDPAVRLDALIDWLRSRFTSVYG